jgi:hypothetical protein
MAGLVAQVALGGMSASATNSRDLNLDELWELW